MTTEPSSANPAAMMHEISAALRRGDVGLAEQMLLSAKPAPALLAAAAEANMRNRRWGDAAWLFDQIPHRDVPAGIKRCLCRNLASLQIHRPAIYQQMISLPKSAHCGIGTSATGHPTIVSRTADGRNLALSPANRPLDALAGAMSLLAPVLEVGQSFALCGLGDGYLFHEIAHKPPKLYLDTEQPVFLLEPDAHVVLTALMIHDYTGPQGPIEQQRIHWFVGPDWALELRTLVRNDLLLPCPPVSLTLGLTAAEIQNTLLGIIGEIAAIDTEEKRALEQYYASLVPSELATLFGENPPRPPRVLFLTTRFSTVLQYATRDAAAGFEQAGWETRTLIEPTRHHRILTVATRATLAEFKPDLVFQIDHQRQEHPGMFPPNLPFVCWVQDHLAHLMTTEAGAQVGENDFVLTDAGPHYVENFGYPQRQIIPLSKLTAPPPPLPRPPARGDDLIFVSNNSRTPQAMLDVLLKVASNAEEQELVTECWRRLIDLHSIGDCLATYRDVCDFLRDLIAEKGLAISERRFAVLARELNHPVCDALYRQQALRWMASAAGEMGLTLAIFGSGWDQHPEFAPFARGPVAHGDVQQELARSAAINFQIAPYLCLHQRLLDGICSGGFFLVREHLSDIAPQAMLDLLETHCGSDIDSLSRARSSVPPPVRDRFESLAKDCVRCLCSAGREDPIAMVRTFQEAQLLVPSAGVLPYLDAISFNDATSLKARIARFVRDPDLREQITAEQRQSIVSRLTYAAAMRRITRRIGGLLPSKPQGFVGVPINIDIGCAA